MSTIEWTDVTWNPVTGCTKVSPGCAHCYAERIFPRPYPGRAFSDVRFHAERLVQPSRWRRPRRVFVNSMSDLFHEALTDLQIMQVFAAMRAAPRHTFQVLTKRADRMLVYMQECEVEPPQNVWLGVSVENQATADERIPLLFQTPAALRFLSVEPLLDKVAFNAFLLDGIDWIIVGGESGPRARRCDIDHVRSVVWAGFRAGIPVFVKQLGSRPVRGDAMGPYMEDRKGGDPAEWPEDLRVREFPR